MEPRHGSAVNENQQRRLAATCRYVDRLLSDLERALIEAQSNTASGRYADDLAPAERRLVADYITRNSRAAPADARRPGAVPDPEPRWPEVLDPDHLTFIDVAIEELKPRYVEGYGAVAPGAESALNGIVEELHGTIQ